MMRGYMGSFGNGTGGFNCSAGVFGFPFSTLLLIGLAILVIYLFSKNRKKAAKKDPMFISDKSPAVDAAEIVRLRYARGEITFEEFQTILKNIQS